MIAEAAFWSGYFILHGRAEDLKEDYIAFVDKHILFEADSPAKSTKKWTLEDYEHATQTDNWHYVYTESNGQPIDRVGKFYWSDLPKDLIDEPGSGLVSGLRAEAYSKRGSMNEKFKQAKLCIGLIIVNHVISAIDGRISAISFNNRLPENSEISIKPIISPSGNLYACLTLEKHF